MQNQVIRTIAEAHRRTPAQVILRWHLQQGLAVIPKSTNAERIAQNIDVFDFALTEEELASVDALDRGVRGGPDPDAVDPSTWDLEIPEP